MFPIKRSCDSNTVVYVTLYKLNKSTCTLYSLSVAPFVIDGNHTVFVAQKNCPVAISCPVKGNPAPNITWYKGDDPSTKISKVNTKKLPETVCNGGLHTYSCFAENHLGNITGTVKVIVGK